jgi:bifunctional DNA-binding transcriptional regulator/antitoxin component of YhaV-PrlF toxin-antitoxin module
MILYMQEKHIRKIVKNGRESFYINIPKEIVKELGWRERQKLTLVRKRKSVVVEDWGK